MICTKCFVDKPVEEYETYFHRPQNKHRTRKYCKSCFKEQKRKYKESIRMKKIIEPEVQELEIEVINPFSTNPDYKLCRTCQEYIHKDGYYNYKTRGVVYKEFLDCKKCINKKESLKRKGERQERKETGGGSSRVRTDVGTWEDDYQKEQTYQVMKALGYTYSEECGHFLKPGVKELVEGELIFPKVKSKKIYTSSINLNDKQREEIIELYFSSKDWSYTRLAKKYHVSTSTIFKIVKKVKNGKTC
jgi:hypothetical protein